MEPLSLLLSLREKHGVSETFSRRFLPLVERAVTTSPEVRQRILELVERSFERQARRERSRPPARRALDHGLLDRVARLLHTWEPAPWLKRWSYERGADAESA